MVQGMGGMMSITGERDDLPGGGPQKAGMPIADIMTGMYATVAVCAALVHRAQSGKGQHLDLALFDTQVAVLANQAANYLATGVSPRRLGNAHPNITPYGSYKTADGAVIIACGNDNLFGKFCAAAGCKDLAIDPRFATNGKRVENRAALDAILGPIIAARTTREWVKLLEGAGVPNGPINTLEEVFREPQAVARGLRFELPHPVAGRVSLVRSPMRFSETPVQHAVPPPLLGQHTEEVLSSLLGLTPPEIEKLRAAGAI
jgi:crotonobetainyl-CoA:carnitine CoA-transferase CaiB-like acyl-CoA transferase